MEVKILIRTPKGQATKTERKLRPFLLGKTKSNDVYVSDDDDQIVWIVTAPMFKVMKISNNIARFDSISNMVFNNKTFKNALRKKLTPEDEAFLKDMLLNQTNIKILKKPTTEESDEFTLTWFERMKIKFKKVDKDGE